MQLVEFSQPTDGQLIARIAGGDRGAFEELHGRYARAVLGLALRRLGDRGRAEDATQDAFIAIWRSARTYDPSRGRGAPWLYAVARNAITDGLRRTPEPVAELEDGPGRDPGPVRRGRGVVDGVARAPRARGASRPRAAGHRARVLERALAERDRRSARDPARHGQDADAERSRTSRRRSGRGAAMRPDFDELVGTDLAPGERERLERVHELLVAAGPPPPEVVRGRPGGAATSPAAWRAPRARRGARRRRVRARRRAGRRVERRERRLHRDDDRNAERRERDGVARGVRHRRGRELADGADGRRRSRRRRAAARSSSG